MEITQLCYFVEVAKSQHITKSAQRLHIAQPALSQAMKRLEQELGVSLFEKNGRNIRLTRYGQYLFEKVEPIMKTLQQLPGQIQTMATEENQLIRLNVLAASSLVTEAIIAYKEDHEHIIFQVQQTDEQWDSDIYIVTSELHKEENKRTSRVFEITEKIYLAVPKGSSLSQRQSIRLEEVANEDFISLMGSKQFRTICDGYCIKAGFSPKVVFESDNPTAVRNMIAARVGIGFWPEFTWGESQNDKVDLLEISEPECFRKIRISMEAHKEDLSQVEDFYQFLTTYITKAADK